MDLTFFNIGIWEKGQIDDLTHASTDPEVCQELYKEFHLV